jgi:hypothetical protein
MQRATVLRPLFPGPPVRKAEQNVIEALAADQPSDASEVALARQVERLARVLRRSPAAVNAQLARAKAKLQARAISYADLHHEAAKNAAARGDGRPSQWALEHLRVVEPIIDKDTGPRMTVVVGVALPGLGLEEARPITTVLQGHPAQPSPPRRAPENRLASRRDTPAR